MNCYAQDVEGRIFAAICAAPAVVLASHGLLEGRKATCYPAGVFTGDSRVGTAVSNLIYLRGLCALHVLLFNGNRAALRLSVMLVRVLASLVCYQS